MARRESDIELHEAAHVVVRADHLTRVRAAAVLVDDKHLGRGHLVARGLEREVDVLVHPQHALEEEIVVRDTSEGHLHAVVVVEGVEPGVPGPTAVRGELDAQVLGRGAARVDRHDRAGRRVAST